jgi:hypothetical protein
MPKILIGLAAIGTAAMLALPAPAIATDRPADGVRNLEQLEVSSARRKKRRVIRHYYGPRYSYYRPYRYGYYRPYYAPYHAYAYSPYYYRPYYRSGPHFGFGPWGFHFGF